MQRGLVNNMADKNVPNAPPASYNNTVAAETLPAGKPHAKIDV